MSCNGFNHGPYCNCGWGGVFYGAGVGQYAWNWQKLDSYTTPNARCPKCPARVYFYRSPYGGTAWFDELGPPWPKHACMDVQVAPSQLPAQTADGSGSTPYAGNNGHASQARWQPAICEGVQKDGQRSDATILKIRKPDGSIGTLFALVESSLIDHRAPFLTKTTGNDGVVEVSTLRTLLRVPEEIQFMAFLTRTLMSGWSQRQIPPSAPSGNPGPSIASAATKAHNGNAPPVHRVQSTSSAQGARATNAATSQRRDSAVRPPASYPAVRRPILHLPHNDGGVTVPQPLPIAVPPRSMPRQAQSARDQRAAGSPKSGSTSGSQTSKARASGQRTSEVVPVVPALALAFAKAQRDQHACYTLGGSPGREVVSLAKRYAEKFGGQSEAVRDALHLYIPMDRVAEFERDVDANGLTDALSRVK